MWYQGHPIAVLSSGPQTFPPNYGFQVQTELAPSDAYQVRSEAAPQASSCLCADEAKTLHWDITAKQLGKWRQGGRGQEGWAGPRSAERAVGGARKGGEGEWAGLESGGEEEAGWAGPGRAQRPVPSCSHRMCYLVLLTLAKLVSVGDT